ncbi:outer membrane beta-barrel family protein [Arthrospiribacter ruber]|uniref:TonB-dependent receptor n=1 Tax=Arthrospiribacter ruber TaxID=2487934 RepID=A0A951MEE0_9BACT|nr:outer membrane beta-barrel family protein [Arthrospiribacter ruber]MBW3467841.1 TonB-dependent receptor [Arthrospiribacter ruber]
MKPILTHLFSLILLLASSSLYGQSYTIKGKVLERGSDNPMEFANVALLNPADSALVTGGMTELDGTFDFPAESGDYILRIGFIGYENYFRNINVGDRNTLNVGNVRLRPDAQNLQEVTVEGVQSMFESDIDKRTFNVENSIVAEGATATELLETLPSIQVDDEGGISMRGSGNILIYINGRPSNLSGDDAESILAQFPANSIKSVELITNPSSRYDAAGVGGIINIILKKNEKTGLNGQVNASIGTRDKYTAGFNMNYGLEKVNIYASYNFQDRRLFREGEGLRESFIPNVSPFLDQDNYGESFDVSHLVRTGLDWNITENKTFGVYAQANFRDRYSFNDLNQRNLNSIGQLDSLFVRNNEDTRTSYNIEAGVNYTWEIDTLGQRLFTSASYSYDDRFQDEFYDQRFFNSFNEEVPDNRLIQINERPQWSNFWVLQVDYEKPFQNGGKFESGLKGTFGEWDRGQDFFQGDQTTNFIPVMDDQFSDGFNFREDVYAGYMSYRNKLGKFGYQGGLRGEYTETTSLQESNQNVVVNNYFNLFPSLYLSYDLGKEEEFTANYSRRISRPNIWALAPLFRVADLFNLSVGNPFLQPELTDSYEVGYMKGWERYLMNATVYHRFSTDILTRVVRVDDNNVAVQTRENANSRSATGFELVNQIQVTDWFDATLTGNLFYSEIIGDNIEEGFNNSNFSWTVSLLANMAVPKFATVQIQGNYRGPIVLPQGEIEPLWGINAGIRKNIMNNRATISANVSDIFNTRIFRIRAEDQRFVQDRMFNRETRIGTLSFTWRFGGFRDRNGRGEREEYDEDMDF